jgi:membrane-bound lytic murein transglycosylase D
MTTKALIQKIKQYARPSRHFQFVIFFTALASSFVTIFFLSLLWVFESTEKEAYSVRTILFKNFPDLEVYSSLSNTSIKLQEQASAPKLPSPKVDDSWSDVMADEEKLKVAPEGETASYHRVETTKAQLLNDFEGRISDQFTVPPKLVKKTEFWFDIYTRYGSQISLIHHSEYPWVILAKVDTSPIFKSDAHKWTKYHRAKALVETTKNQVIASLKKLSKKPNIKNPSLKEMVLIEALKEVPGKRARVYGEAARDLRVQMGQRDFYRSGLIAGEQYINSMEQIFARHNLPLELTRLPLVESSFNTKAISKVGASGIWQFMPNIGKKLMRVEENIDERNSPLKATEAAAKLMKENLQIFKSWPLAVTAYNHGAGGLLKAIRATGTRDLSTIIGKYNSRSFGFASSNFYAEFLAALHAEVYQDYVFGETKKKAPLLSETIKLKSNLSTKLIASITDLTFEQIRLYNPDLRSQALSNKGVLPRGYSLHLPIGKKEALESYFVEALNTPVKNPKKSRGASSSDSKEKSNSKKVQATNKPHLKGTVLSVSKTGATKVLKIDFSQPKETFVEWSDDEVPVIRAQQKDFEQN